MNFLDFVLEMFLILGATIILMVLLGAFSRSILGVRVSTSRIIVAGVVGLGAGVGFGTQVVWNNPDATGGMIPLLIGVIGLVTIATLVVAELLIPQGSLPPPTQWVRLTRQAVERNRRYLELLRISTRHRLFAMRFSHARTAQQITARRQQAKALKSALEEAGGAFVKIGQLLSTRADVLPAEFLVELGKLQQDVPPVPWAEVQPELEGSLGKPYSEVFRRFEQTPFAAASIGQVHTAVLSSDQSVAVKIRRPGIVPVIERDLDIARRLARRLARSSEWAAQFGVEELVESLAVSLQEELDFTVEAANIAALTETQQHIAADARVKIPAYMDEYSSDRVIVMEYITGVTLSDTTELASWDAETRSKLAQRLLAAMLAQIMDIGVFHSDLHPGNIIISPDGQLVLLDFGSVGRIDSETRKRLGEVLLAFARKDAGAFTDALIEFLDPNDVDDESGLRRAIATFMVQKLGPGAQFDASIFGEVISVLSDYGLSAPQELTVPFRAIATLEGSLTILDPRFDFIAESGDYAQQRIKQNLQPASVAETFTQELMAARPLIQRLPHRLDHVTRNLAQGTFSTNVRMLADRRDRNFIREVLGLAVLTFLAGVFGMMSAILLASDTGPQLTDTLNLFQVFGYLFLVITGVLSLRVVFDVLGRGRKTPHR